MNQIHQNDVENISHLKNFNVNVDTDEDVGVVHKLFWTSSRRAL